MPYVAAALVMVALLCLLNLLVMLGVIKRLRLHTELLSSREGGPARDITRPVGERVGDFTVTAVDGEPLSRDMLAPGTLVGFFAPDCAPCKAKLPGFVEYARTVPRPVVAVVVADEDAGDEEAAATVSALMPVARVAVEHPDGPVGRAFGVIGFPVFCLLGEDRRIAASRMDIGGLPVAAPA